MLIWFENCDYPAIATPFKGQVYFSKQFSLVDVHGYYESKGIYTVEQVGGKYVGLRFKFVREKYNYA